VAEVDTGLEEVLQLRFRHIRLSGF